MHSTSRVVGRGLAVIGVFVAGLAYLYRPLLADGFVSGDVFDARIQIAILENWSNCLSGRGDCLSPNYFHPTPVTLGYNDGYLVSGLIYAVGRRFGLDPFLAYEAVAVAVRACGFAALIGFATRVLRLSFWFSLLAALLWLISLNTYIQVAHSQLLYSAFFPIGLLLLVRIEEAVGGLDTVEARASLRHACTSALHLGAFAMVWAVTAYYSFFFFTLFAFLYVAAFFIRRRDEAAAVVRALISRPGLIALLTGAAACAPLGLTLVYGRALRDTGGHSWFAGSAPRLYELFNVGPNALVWSPVLRPVYALVSGRALTMSEMSTGFPLLFLALVVVGTVQASAATNPLALGNAADAAERHRRDVLAALSLAAAGTILLVLAFGGGYSAWKIMMQVFPGASAIRVPSRAMLLVTPVLCLIVAATLSSLRNRFQGRRWIDPALAALVVFLLAEQIQTRPDFHLDRHTEMTFLASLPPPPDECQSFYVSVPRFPRWSDTIIDRYYIHAVDAMLIAALHRLPTLNGMATFTPKGWDLTAPFEPDYTRRVAAHAAAHGLDGVCALDLKARRWSLADL